MIRAAGGRAVPRRRLPASARATLTCGLLGACALVTGALGLGGCWGSAPVIVDFSTPRRDYPSSEYQDVYQRWTRHEKIMFGVEAALEVWATYKSQEFRQAFVAHYADTYKLREEARSTLARAQGDAAAVAYEFVVTAQSANYKWNDLEKKSSPWRVLLVDGAGHELSAEQITVERLPDLFEREFYPAKTPFSKTYAIRFTRGAGREDGFTGERSGELILRFAGPLASGDLRWSNHP